MASVKDRWSITVDGYLRNYVKKWKMSIPIELIQVIIMFYRTEIKSQILINDEIHKLYDMVGNKLNVDKLEWSLIWRGSEHGFNQTSFVNKCHNLRDIVVIIHSIRGLHLTQIKSFDCQHDAVFGGYSSNGFQKDIYDTKSFLYLIRSNQDKHEPFIFPRKSSQPRSSYVSMSNYCLFTFGNADIWVRIENNTNYSKHIVRCGVNQRIYDWPKECIIDRIFDLLVDDIEVYQLTYFQTKPILNMIGDYRNDITQLFRNKAEWKEYRFVIQSYQTKIDMFNLKDLKKTNNALLRHSYDLLNVLKTFNDTMCAIVDSNDDGSNQLIMKTDELRDVILPKYGIKLEDGITWKMSICQPFNGWLMIDKRKKKQNKIEHLQRSLNEWQRKSIKPSEYFQRLTDDFGQRLFSQFDDMGFPTHNKQNQPLSNNKKKKLQKLIQKQSKWHQDYLEEIKENPNFIQDIKNQLKALKN